MRDAEQNPFPIRQTVFLQNATQQRDLNDIQTALRNIFPRMKIYGVASQMAITMAGTPEDVADGKSLIAELDRSSKTYRITYTLTEIDNGARGAAQKYVLIAASGERTNFVEGTKVPIVTGETDKADSSSQIQYIDLGLKIRATPVSSADGLRLDTSIEQSSVASEKAANGPDPTMNQTMLDGTAYLVEGKPRVLGSLDVPGTTKRLEIEVVAETVK
jgi:type II secretory pathway component GspD/PulD (secretin)